MDVRQDAALTESQGADVGAERPCDTHVDTTSTLHYPDLLVGVLATGAPLQIAEMLLVE